MKVCLAAKAIFYFDVQLKLIRQLLELSKLHYDGECQRASARAGQTLYPGSTWQSDRNGILTVMRDRFEHDAIDETKVEVRCTWDDLDLIAKICEFPPRRPGFDDAIIFRGMISRMLDFAGPKIMKEWKVEFEV